MQDADISLGNEELGTEEQPFDAMQDLKMACEKEPEVVKLLEMMDPHLTQFVTLDKVMACLGCLRIVDKKHTYAYELDCMGKKYLRLRRKLNAIKNILDQPVGNNGGDFLRCLNTHCCLALNDDEDLRRIMDDAMNNFSASNGNAGIIDIFKERTRKPLNEMDNHRYLSILEWMPNELMEQLCEYIKGEFLTLAAELSAWVQDIYLNDIWPKYKKFTAT